MALPKRRWSTHRQGKKRSGQKIKLPGLISCPNCKKLILPHRVCVYCGQYKKKLIIKSKMTKRLDRQKQKTAKVDKKPKGKIASLRKAVDSKKSELEKAAKTKSQKAKKTKKE